MKSEDKKDLRASPQETGGSAFPEVYTDHKWDARHSDFMQDTYSAGGMTLRDYFAAKALQGLLSDAWMKSDNSSIQSFADEAYNWADAMIQARKGGAA